MNGAEFRNKRNQLGLSQEKIARKLPCSVDSVRAWEQNKNEAPDMTRWFFVAHGIME